MSILNEYLTYLNEDFIPFKIKQYSGTLTCFDNNPDVKLILSGMKLGNGSITTVQASYKSHMPGFSIRNLNKPIFDIRPNEKMAYIINEISTGSISMGAGNSKKGPYKAKGHIYEYMRKGFIADFQIQHDLQIQSPILKSVWHIVGYPKTGLFLLQNFKNPYPRVKNYKPY